LKRQKLTEQQQAIKEFEKKYELFFDSIRSEETRDKYSAYLRKYFEITGTEIPLSGNSIIGEKQDSKVISDQIIDFINKMKKEGKAYGAIHNYVTVILSFYKIYDVVLNIAKIRKFMPEQRKVKKGGRGYKHEEIQKLLEIADERMRAVILLLCSSGCRIGVIPLLRVGSLQDRKLIVYESTKDEYYTFISLECKKAVDAYIDMRSRYGEKINDDSPLIREQFDIRDPIAIRRCKGIGRNVLQWKLEDLARRSNVRTKEVPISHGFRRFYTGQLIKSGVQAEARLMLEGHSTGITDHYWRPSEDDLFRAYSLGENNLTIDPNMRLKREIQVLTIEKSKADLALLQIQEMEKRLNQLSK